MKHNIWTYTILLVVASLSAAATLLLPIEGILKGIAASPGLLAMLTAVFQVLRDQAAFEKQLIIQKNQFRYSIGAASHMANTAFDKHAEFCEKYMAEIHVVLHKLFQKAETAEALEHAWKLHSLREEYAVWLTDEINEELGKFEAALRKLGATAHFVQTTVGSEAHAQQRSLRIGQNSDLFDEILHIDETKEINEEHAIDAVKKKVRKILGVAELTRLREHLISKACEAIGAGT